MKKFINIFMYILLFPFVLIGLIYVVVYMLIELMLVKHFAYFKKNKLKLRGHYYIGILQDPIFRMKNMICKYDLSFKVIELDDINNIYLIIDNNECHYIYASMKNVYYSDHKLYFQYNSDEVGNALLVDDFIESVISEKYNFENSKLIIMDDLLSKKDKEIIKEISNIVVVRRKDKELYNLLVNKSIK